MSKIIHGFLKLGKKIPFCFNQDNNILELLATDNNGKNIIEIYIKKLKGKKIDIDGETLDKRYIRFFNVKIKTFDFKEFKAFIPAYLIGMNNNFEKVIKPTDVKEIIFFGECITRVLPPKESVKKNINYKKKIYSLTHFGDYDSHHSFEFENKKYKFLPKIILSKCDEDGKSKMEVTTCLFVSSDKKITFKGIIDTYKEVQKLFSFLCYRSHVSFQNIILNQRVLVDYGNQVREEIIKYKLFVAEEDREYDLPLCDNVLNISEHMHNIPFLIKNLLMDDYILSTMPINKNDLIYVDTNKFLAMSTSFEALFLKKHKKYKSSKNKDYYLAKKKTLLYLKKQIDDEKNNRKMKKYFKSFYNEVMQLEGRLEEKLKFYYEKYENILKDDINRYKEYHNIDIITKELLSQAFSSKRNVLSHGLKKIENFSLLEILSYCLLRKIVYGMILENSNFEPDDIKMILDTMKIL